MRENRTTTGTACPRAESRNCNKIRCTGALAGFYYSHGHQQWSPSFPMRSKGPFVTKRPLTSGTLDVKAEYRANTLPRVCVRSRPHGRVCTRASRTLTHAAVGRWDIHPYWTTLRQLQLAFTTYVLCVRLRALRLRYIYTYIYVMSLVTSFGRVGCAVETST